MRYILRQTILESTWERQTKEIIELVKKVPIEEVMFMEQSHQIMMVPYPLSKHKAMAEIYKKIAQQLREVKVDFSINLATIVGHSDAPVSEDMVLPFQKFVGEDLKERHAIYCIGDVNWQSYAQEVVSLYAQTQPKRIMIDDDFRSLNHTAQFGCFCDLHLDAIRNELSLPKTFEAKDLIESLLGKTDDEIRLKQAWQKINFEFQLSAAQKIEKAIHSIDPNIEIGLMNSGEQAHSLQGRDMSKLLEAFAGKGKKALSRPAGGVYADGVHNQIINMHQTPALSYYASKIDTTWVSEVENWPHSRYIKSVTTTKLQMLMHTLFGANAITLNLYDYLATPHYLEPSWEDLLIELKPKLKHLQSIRNGKKLKGVSLPWESNYASLNYNRSHNFDDLYPRRPLDLLLPQMGIPTQFEPSNINVLLGDEVLSYSQGRLLEFLSKGLLVDNIAAKHLIKKGFQEYLGVTFGEKLTEACTERLTDSNFSSNYYNCDLPTNWFRMDIQGDSIDRMNLYPEAKAISHFVNHNNEIISPSISIFQNQLGGKVAVIAQTVQELAFLHRGKSIQIQSIFQWMDCKFDEFFIKDQPNIAPFIYEDDNQGLYVLVNTGLDEVKITLPKGLESVFEEELEHVKIKPFEFKVYTYKVKI
jgi:hypothetical protein